MTANAWRGEVEMVLDGNVHVLRPTFEALNRIEQELGTGLLALARKLAEETMTLEELVVIVTHCVVSDIPLHGVKEMLVKSGAGKVIHAVAEMLSHVFGSGDATLTK